MQHALGLLALALAAAIVLSIVLSIVLDDGQQTCENSGYSKETCFLTLNR